MHLFSDKTGSFLPYLQHYPSSGLARRVPLRSMPFRIGRSNEADFVIPSQQVSKIHAEIFGEKPNFRIRDLQSTNGTFVNGQPITECELTNNDVIHVAHEEFRFVTTIEGMGSSSGLCAEMTPMTEPVKGDVPPSVYLGRQYLKEMLVKKCVRVLFQPIVSLDSEGTAGYEALARGTHSALSIKPVELFNLAQRCDMASSLSAMFRQAAIKDAAQLPGSGYLFLNIHPSEMHGDELLLSLRDLQATAPTNWQLVLEINEHAVADLPVWRRLRQQVKELGLLLAYDDFGAGQARILELADLPPDFVKLDMALIRNIHLVPSRQKVVQALAQASRKMGVQVIAEGIECDGEARTCRELGCHLGQGFLFAAPQGLGAIRAPFATSP